MAVRKYATGESELAKRLVVQSYATKLWLFREDSCLAEVFINHKADLTVTDDRGKDFNGNLRFILSGPYYFWRPTLMLNRIFEKNEMLRGYQEARGKGG